MMNSRFDRYFMCNVYAYECCTFMILRLFLSMFYATNSSHCQRSFVHSAGNCLTGSPFCIANWIKHFSSMNSLNAPTTHNELCVISLFFFRYENNDMTKAIAKVTWIRSTFERSHNDSRWSALCFFSLQKSYAKENSNKCKLSNPFSIWMSNE